MQQQGGSQYGDAPPDMAQFAAPGAHMLGISGGASHHQHQLAEAASPISSRPPPPAPSRQNFEDLAPGLPGSFTDEDALASGEEVERGGVPGNRWPRQETLALLKIRSEMDAAFRDATIKGPLWEDISRKLAELGYMRSAKKCKEKFENVHKYYKRTKEGRAGRQDGKSYRFFTELEALHGGAVITTTTTTTTMANTTTAPPAITATAAFPIGISSSMPGSARPQPLPISAPGPPLVATPTPLASEPTPTAAPPKISSSAAATGIMSFSSDTFSSSSSDFDDEDTEEGDASKEGRKRKRDAGSGGGSQKMMAFFEGLMKQVMERQEVMQQRFLETIEKREQDRMIREEAWKRQEMTRLTREHELMAQERAMAASRDAAVISYLQRISGQSIQLPPAVAIPAAPPPKPSLSPSPPPPPPPQQHRSTQQPQQPHHQPEPSAPPLQQQPPQQQHQRTELVRHQPPLSSNELVLVPVPDPQEVVGSGGFEGASTSSRWPKSEVHALIKLRSGLDPRYQESGPKGPLWEEISAGMQRLGYNRSSKRCKEKWENINKYFKKVKESNRKRPEDAKTCPYFHQLDALYRQKLLGTGGVVFGIHKPQDQGTNPNTQERSNNIPMSNAPPPPPETQQNPHPEIESKKGNSEGVLQIQTSNGGVPTSFFGEGASNSAAMKKPADIVKETMEQQQHQKSAMDDYEKMDEHESDSIDDDDDDEDDAKMQYKIEFQRPNVGGGGGNASAASAAGSFLAMVQ